MKKREKLLHTFSVVDVYVVFPRWQSVDLLLTDGRFSNPFEVTCLVTCGLRRHAFPYRPVNDLAKSSKALIMNCQCLESTACDAYAERVIPAS